MRRNGFGDFYCHTANEVRTIIECGDSRWQVYVVMHEPPKDGEKATCEVLTNVAGDTVCYIEAKTLDEVTAIVKELDLEVQ